MVASVSQEGTDAERLLDTRISDRRIAPLLDRAAAMTRALAGDRGYVWTAIGIESTPCDMGCTFCSHAAKWDAYTASAAAFPRGHRGDRPAGWPTAAPISWSLRTTQHYPVATLAALGRRVRERIGDDIHLVVNTGEMDLETVRILKDAGFSMAYHVVRLREGVDTGHSVDMRLRTIEAVRAGGLELQYLIEPLGPEHTAAEILTEARRARSVGASGTGVMARVPVMGTPLARFGQVSEAYLRRVAAAARLEYPTAASTCACIRRRRVPLPAAATPSSSSRPPIPATPCRAGGPGTVSICRPPGRPCGPPV